MESKNIKYIPHLDHLRAYAALLIVFYHATQLVWHQWAYNGPFLPQYWTSHRLVVDNPFVAFILEGHTAVALFMVLSGFIFTFGTYQRRISYKKFIINRLLRTYPLFVLLMFVGAFAYPEKFRFLAFLQTLFAMGNAHGALEGGAFSAMFWTNAIEWQFYLVFPFLLVIVNRSGIRVLPGLVAVFVVMRGLAFLSGADIRDLSYWTIIGRMDQFLIGMGLAVLYRREVPAGYRKLVPLLAVGILGLLLWVNFWLHQHGGWPAGHWWKMFWPDVEGVLWAAFIFLYLMVGHGLPAPFSRVLCAIGRMSYSMYLLHFVIIQIALQHSVLFKYAEDDLVISSLINAVVVILPLTLLLSFLTFTYIEKPFLDMRVVYKKSP